MEKRRTLQVIPEASRPAEIGRLIWMLQDCRSRTLDLLAEVQPEWIDWEPPHGESVGTVLYHLALVEASWLYEEILELPGPPNEAALFPYPVRDDLGHLQAVRGETLAQHLARLAEVRESLLAAMDLVDLRRLRTLPGYDVTPEWVLHHLMQHEAEHRGQIGVILSQIRAQ